MVQQLEQLSGRQISRLKFEFELSICWPDQPVRALIPAFLQVSSVWETPLSYSRSANPFARLRLVLLTALAYLTRLNWEKKRRDVNRVC